MSDDVVTQVTGGPRRRSAVAAIAAQLDTKLEPRIAVPRFTPRKGELANTSLFVVVLRELPGDTITGYQRAPTTAKAADLLVRHCQRIEMYDPAEGEYFDAREELGIDQPVRIDGNLVKIAMEMPVEKRRGFEEGMNPRAICMALFANQDGKVSPDKIGAATGRYIEQSVGANINAASDEEVEEAAGEADAATS